MRTKPDQVQARLEVKRYKIQYPISDYTFPHDVRIHQVRFNDQYLHVELTDGRALSIPLWWIPTLHNAAPGDREKYEISRDRTMIIWDPDKCAINDEVRIADYLEPDGSANHIAEESMIEYRKAHAPRRRHTRAVSVKTRG